MSTLNPYPTSSHYVRDELETRVSAPYVRDDFTTMYSTEEIEDTLEAIRQRVNTIQARNMSSKPDDLMRATDDGATPTSAVWNDTITNAQSVLVGPQQEPVHDSLEMLRANDDVFGPGWSVIALEDDYVQNVLQAGDEAAQKVSLPDLEQREPPVSSAEIAKLSAEMLHQKGFDYGKYQMEQLIDDFKGARSTNEKNLIAMTLVREHGWGVSNFLAVGFPIQDLDKDIFRKEPKKDYLTKPYYGLMGIPANEEEAKKQAEEWEKVSEDDRIQLALLAHPDIKANILKSPTIRALERQYRAKRMYEIQNSPPIITMDHITRGMVAAFNAQFGTDYGTFNNLVSAFADQRMPTTQASWMRRNWRTAMAFESSSSSNIRTADWLDKLETAGYQFNSGQSFNAAHEPILSLAFGTTSPNDLMTFFGNQAQYPHIQAGYSKLEASWYKRMEALAIDTIEAGKAGQHTMTPEAVGAMFSASAQQLPDTLLDIASGGSHFLDPANSTYAGFVGNFIGRNYSQMEGGTRNAEVKKKVRDAMAVLETMRSGRYNSHLMGSLQFLMGIRTGAIVSGNWDELQKLLMESGLSRESSLVLDLFFAEAQQEWGPRMSTATEEGMKGMLEIVNNKYRGLMNVVAQVATGDASEVNRLISPQVKTFVDTMGYSTMIGFLDSDDIAFAIQTPESVDAQRYDAAATARLASTTMDELLRAAQSTGMFKGVQTGDEMIKQLYEGLDKYVGKYIPDTVTDMDDKLAYGMRILLSDPQISDALKGALLATGIHNKTVTDPDRIWGPNEMFSFVGVFLEREGLTAIPMTYNEETGDIFGKAAPKNQDWSGEYWPPPTEDETRSVVLAAKQWDNISKLHLQDLASIDEVHRMIVTGTEDGSRPGILVRNFNNTMTNRNGEPIGIKKLKEIAEEVWQKYVVNRPDDEYPYGLIELHFRMAQALVEAGEANVLVKGIADQGISLHKASRMKGFLAELQPDENYISGQLLGRRNPPHVRLNKSEKEVDYMGGFWLESEGEDVISSTWDIPWWIIHDNDQRFTSVVTDRQEYLSSMGDIMPRTWWEWWVATTPTIPGQHVMARQLVGPEEYTGPKAFPDEGE